MESRLVASRLEAKIDAMREEMKAEHAATRAASAGHHARVVKFLIDVERAGWALVVGIVALTGLMLALP